MPLALTLILPQKWVEQAETAPPGWFDTNAPGLVKKVPEIHKWVDEVVINVGVSWKLLVTRMQLEQSAITYKWDGTTKDYAGGLSGESTKLLYLCGADKTDSGPRSGGWFGPKKQLLALALRFKYWYRGINPNSDWSNWLGLTEDPAFKTDVSVTRNGQTITPANQISADCLRYTTSITAKIDLKNLAQKWFPNDFIEKPKMNFVVVVKDKFFFGEISYVDMKIRTIGMIGDNEIITIPIENVISITRVN